MEKKGCLVSKWSCSTPLSNWGIFSRFHSVGFSWPSKSYNVSYC